MDGALRSHYCISRRDRAVLERGLQHPNPRVQRYVAELIYHGERERAESRLAWEQDEPPIEWMPAYDAQALLETDHAGVFREMEDGNCEPLDDDGEQAVQGWAR